MNYDNWNEIASDLNSCKIKNVSEKDYHTQIEQCLKQLGWKTSNDTMKSKVKIPVGHGGYIEPDIVLYKKGLAIKEGIPVLPIEIKEPNHKGKGKDVSQLTSYMRQFKLDVGLYIGESIGLFYDSSTHNTFAEEVLNVPIEKDNEKGGILCKMLEYESFDLVELRNFALDCYNKKIAQKDLQQRLQGFLLADDGEKNIKNLISDKLIEEGFDEKLLKAELKKLSLNISWDKEAEAAKDLSKAPKPNNDKPKSGKASPSRLKITLGDGSVIMEPTSKESVIAFVQKVGVEKVAALDLPTVKGKPILSKEIINIRKDISEKYKSAFNYLTNDYYIYLWYGNKELSNIIAKIAKQLDIVVQIEMVEK